MYSDSHVFLVVGDIFVSSLKSLSKSEEGGERGKRMRRGGKGASLMSRFCIVLRGGEWAWVREEEGGRKEKKWGPGCHDKRHLPNSRFRLISFVPLFQVRLHFENRKGRLSK